MNKLKINFRKIMSPQLSFNRNVQRILQISFDTLAIFVAYASAMFLRLETFAFLNQPRFLESYVLVLLPTIITFTKMGLYLAVVRYVSIEIAVLVALGCGLSATFLIFAKLFFASYIPWSVPIIFGALLFIFITGLRFTLRTILRVSKQKNQKYIAIYGAGVTGVQLMQSLKSSPDYRVQMIIDDSSDLNGQFLFGLRVISFEEAVENFEAMDIDILLMAMPSASFVTKQKIISKVSEFAIQVKTIPAIANIIDGSTQITQFRDVKIEDLLGRESVNPLPELLNKNIYNKTVLVTGAGGSIGSELCRQILLLKPKKLLLFDVSELAIYNITEELEKKADKLGVKLIPLVGDVQDKLFVTKNLKQYNVDGIYHAAAYKHVPLMERNIIQAVKNNTIGTLILAQEAVRSKVSFFTLISTDKAVKPTNIMGASKRLAEHVCQAMNENQNITRFSIVRFGNVLGSSGSVVPLFQKQIATGGPITLTHPEISRFFMTISEAAQLVIQSSSIVKGGELLVLDMGVPVKIKDLAIKMVKLSGLRPYFEGQAEENEGDIAIKITGLRPGEKMYEELSYGQNMIRTIHPRIMTVNEKVIKAKDMKELIKQLKTLISNQDNSGLMRFLNKNADYTKLESCKKRKGCSLKANITENNNKKIESLLVNTK